MRGVTPPALAGMATATPASTAPPSEASVSVMDEEEPSITLRHAPEDEARPAASALSDDEVGPILQSKKTKEGRLEEAFDQVVMASANGHACRAASKAKRPSSKSTVTSSMTPLIERLEKGLERLEIFEQQLEETMSMRPEPDWEELAHDADRFNQLAARGSTSRPAVVIYITLTALLIVMIFAVTQTIGIFGWSSTDVESVEVNAALDAIAANVLDTRRAERPWYPAHENPSPTGWFSDLAFLRMTTVVLWMTLCTTGLGMEVTPRLDLT
jgi:hypothetical protein